MRKVKNLKTSLLKTTFTATQGLLICGLLQACSLSKPGDKDRSTLLNTSSFESLSIAKKKPGSGSTTTANNTKEETSPEEQAKLAAASFTSGQAVSLGNFVNKQVTHAKECGETPALHKIAYISGNVALNLEAVRALLDEKQKDKKPEDRKSLETIAQYLFEDHESILKNEGEPIIQWVNYCQKSSDDPNIYGWITDNTLMAAKTASLPMHNNLLHHSEPFSLAWAQHQFISNILSINPAIAADIDLNNIQVPVYPLVDSKIADKEITAKYVKQAAANYLPKSLQIKFGASAELVGQAINEGSAANEKIFFPKEERVITAEQNTQIEGLSEATFSNNERGTSIIFMRVKVLKADGSIDDQNFFTWMQNLMDSIAGIKYKAVLVTTGNKSTVVLPSEDDLKKLAAQATPETTQKTPNTTTSDDSAKTKDSAQQQTGQNTGDKKANAGKNTRYIPPPVRPSYASGQSTTTYGPPLPPRSTSGTSTPQLVAKAKAALQPTLNPLQGTSITCPDDYNLISLDLSCSSCMGADLDEFGWTGLSQTDLQKNVHYKLFDDLFGKGKAAELLKTFVPASYTLNLCFNDEEITGAFQDNTYPNPDGAQYLFFENGEFRPIVTELLNGQRYLILTTQVKTDYTSFPDEVNALKTVQYDGLIKVNGHTLFYMPNPNNSTEYIVSEDPSLAPRLPDNQKQYIDVYKQLQFKIPLNDLANQYKDIGTPAVAKLGAKSIPQNPPTVLLAAFKSLDYLIAGETAVGPVTYVRNNEEIYKDLGATLVEDVVVNTVVGQVADDPNEEPVDMVEVEDLMQEAASDVSKSAPGSEFNQPDAVNFNPEGTLLAYSDMVHQCQSFSYRFAVNIKGRYTTVQDSAAVEKETENKKQYLESKGSDALDKIGIILGFVKNIAQNSKRTHWSLYVCSNSVDSGILSDDAYVAFLDTMPYATNANVQGVFKVSNQHSSIVFQPNSNKTAVIAGIDIASFDIHGPERVTDYLNITGPTKDLIMASIRKKPPTRMNFQFTGQVKLRKNDLVQSSKAIVSHNDFHMAQQIRRLPFQISSIDNVFTVSTKVTGSNILLEDSITFYKNSQLYQGSENFSGLGLNTSIPFDGFMQTFGELGAFRFGFWFES